jgi:hypothetical protein
MKKGMGRVFWTGLSLFLALICFIGVGSGADAGGKVVLILFGLGFLIFPFFVLWKNR